mmetsp:Transcript_82406/g.176502  ORF Transcript_82406/g.176502 Transcript_82406/m.176502 type:complete len:201 (-) Transcript_82406:291-893(-)
MQEGVAHLLSLGVPTRLLRPAKRPERLVSQGLHPRLRRVGKSAGGAAALAAAAGPCGDSAALLRQGIAYSLHWSRCGGGGSAAPRRPARLRRARQAPLDGLPSLLVRSCGRRGGAAHNAEAPLYVGMRARRPSKASWHPRAHTHDNDAWKRLSPFYAVGRHLHLACGDPVRAGEGLANNVANSLGAELHGDLGGVVRHAD